MENGRIVVPVLFSPLSSILRSRTNFKGKYMKVTGRRKHLVNQLNVTGNFKITKELIEQFGKLYSGKPLNTGDTAQVRYNNKLSALSLIKEKRLAGIPAKDIQEGFIYIVSNPAWDGYYKVGVSLDPRDRLKSYQTSSPFQDFKLEGWYFSYNARSVEKEIHSRLERFRTNGEWFELDLENLRKFLLRHKQIMD